MRPERGHLEAARIAREFGLDAERVLFFRVPPQAMLTLGTYGAFDRYGHWSRGKAYHRLRLQSDLGLQRMYEVILRADLPKAYVLLGNRAIEDLAVFAHVLGHADFFRHSLALEAQDPLAERRFLLHRRRIADYCGLYGQTAVEQVLDRALLLEHYSAPDRPQDVLGAVARGGMLTDWQRDCLFMIRDEALHFRVQERTKVLNEGWATFWHLRILRALELDWPDLLEVATLHSRIVASTPGRVNPYALGLAILEDVALRHGALPGDAPQGDALEALREVRDGSDDFSLVHSYLTQAVVDRLKLRVEVDGSFQDDVEAVREALAKTLGAGARPRVEVEQADPGVTLRLLHVHDGRDLDVPEAETVLGEVQALWGAPVQMATQVGEQRLVLRHDGTRLTRFS